MIASSEHASAASLQEHLHRMMRGRMLVNTFEHERYHDNVRREREDNVRREREAAPTCAHDASSPSVQEDRHGHGIGDGRDAVARSEYTNSTTFGETARQLPHVHVTSLTRARLAIAGMHTWAKHRLRARHNPQRVCKPSDTCARVVPAVLSCGIITRLRKNGFGAQRLCLPKQCVALNVPNSPKFTRAMISQHMYCRCITSRIPCFTLAIVL